MKKFYICFSIIGSGSFGVISRELYREGSSEAEWKTVAVKTPKTTSDEVNEEMEAEAHIMSKLNHPNVTKYYGISRVKGKILIVMEELSGGDLATFLKEFDSKSVSYFILLSNTNRNVSTLFNDAQRLPK